MNQAHSRSAEIVVAGGDAFLAISNRAKGMQDLTPWDRRFAYTVVV
jgi:hypothetical protein